MRTLRWFGLLISIFCLVSAVMMGRFWAVLHLAQSPDSGAFNMYNQGSPSPPANLSAVVWACTITSVIALAVLLPAVYFLVRRWTALMPYVIAMTIASAVALPILYQVMKPHSVRQQATQWKYADMLIGNCIVCVMGTLLGTSLVACVDGQPTSKRDSVKQTSSRKKRKQSSKRMSD